MMFNEGKPCWVFPNRARGCLELMVGTFFHQRLGVRDDPAIVSNILIFAGPNLDTPESSMLQIYDLLCSLYIKND